MMGLSKSVGMVGRSRQTRAAAIAVHRYAFKINQRFKENKRLVSYLWG